jgi:hypothetical protein
MFFTAFQTRFPLPIIVNETVKKGVPIMAERKLSADSTVYHYTLVRKLNARPLYGALSLAALAGYMLFAGLHDGRPGVAAAFASLAAVPLLHYVFTRMYIAYTRRHKQLNWKMRWSVPWPGYLPAGSIAFSAYSLWLHQLAWIGAAAISLLYVWLPDVWFYSLLFMHVWILLPRYVVFFSFRNLKKDGIVRFDANDISYYQP